MKASFNSFSGFVHGALTACGPTDHNYLGVKVKAFPPLAQTACYGANRFRAAKVFGAVFFPRLVDPGQPTQIYNENRKFQQKSRI